MCGIVGVFPLKQPDVEISPTLQRALTFWFHNEILFHTIKRGKDATGFVATYGKCNDPAIETAPTFWACLKQPVDAEDFIVNDGTDKRYAGQAKNANFEFLMEHLATIDRPLLHVIGHTRAKTTGTELNPLNNHPIVVGNIMGVHNGGVKNYKKIFEKHPEMKALGDVDSEAIFQLLAENANERALDAEAIKYVCERIEGPRAVIAFNNQHPQNVAFFHDVERPMEMVHIPQLGILVITSERDFFRAALAAYQRLRLLYSGSIPGEGKLPKVSTTWEVIASGEGGIINVEQDFPTNQKLSSFINLHRVPPIFPDYKVETTTTTTTGYGYQGGSTSWDKDRNRASQPNGFTGQHSHGPSSSVGSTDPKQLPEKTGTAEVEDYSNYEQEGTEDVADVTARHVPTSEIVDDPTDDGDVEVNMVVGGEDDDGTSFGDEETRPGVGGTAPVQGGGEELYSDTEIKTLGDQDLFEPAFKENKSTIFHRHKGKMKELLNARVQLTEDEAAETIEMIYNELFSDGFLFGFRKAEDIINAAWESMAEEEEESKDKIGADLFRLNEEVEELKKLVADVEKEKRAAVAMVANMKGFIFATMLAKGLIKVNDEDKVEFDEDIEDLFGYGSNGFAQVKLDLVKKLFHKKDKAIIREGLSAKSRSVNKPRLGKTRA